MKEKLNTITNSLKNILFWLLLSIGMGFIGGSIGTVFSKTISFVTDLRTDNNWLVYFLPVGGLISVAFTKMLKVQEIGTNQVFESARGENKVSFLLAPAVFIGSSITHLFGGSAGREGAALQLGGGFAELLCKIFKIDNIKRGILIRCGMAAFFSAIFGTPLAASVFALEVITVGKLIVSGIFPVFTSGITAYLIAHSLGADAERFYFSANNEISLILIIKVLAISAVGAFISILFCKSLHFTEKIFKKYIKNNYLKAIIGGVIIVILTLIVGSNDYNGGGLDVINRIFTDGEVKYESFILKIIFTIVTVAAGYKGGEIIPTLFIGSTLGGSMAMILGLDLSFGGAVGMTALFCGVTNCPIASILLSVEMFGSDGIIYYAIAVVTVFLLSGKSSLYSSQKFCEDKCSL